MAIMTDHADRKWCKDPSSKEWMAAALKQWRFDNPFATPKVAISSAHPRVPTMFERVMK